jgi:hypothetical protein
MQPFEDAPLFISSILFIDVEETKDACNKT